MEYLMDLVDAALVGFAAIFVFIWCAILRELLRNKRG